jgi:DNA-directed RNA polymerase specialized sigma24 family protein
MTQTSRLGLRAGTVASPRPFEEFVAADAVRLKRVVYAHFGVDLGPEAMGDVMAYAWEHWDRVGAMDNAVGYLYRVAQSSMRRQYRWQRPEPVLPPTPSESPTEFPELPAALARLSPHQRTAVVLVHSLGWTLAEAAASMNLSVSTLRNHLRRGLTRLRRDLGGPDV